jgi:signal peptidase II
MGPIVLKAKRLILPFIVLPLVGLDQLSKWWILHHLGRFESISVVENFFHIRHVLNTGGAFGFLSASTSVYVYYFFVLFTVVAIGFIGLLYAKLDADQHWPAVAIALIIAGALGNFIDRLRFRAVIDFLDVHVYSHHWPTFNIADSAITVGSLALGACILMRKW